MQLLIDGYNLLHATDLFGTGAAAGTLAGSREALLGFLTGALTLAERRRTTIVFDAADAPPGLPATISHEGITVHFARDYPDADSMIEALIDAQPRGKGLLVVSSDHRVQRAARSHGARWSEAAAWYHELRSRAGAAGVEPLEKGGLHVGDADYWAEQFTDQATLDALANARREEDRRAEDQRRQNAAERAAGKRPANKPGKPSKPTQAFGEGIFEGFPPGYAEDLAEEFGDSRDMPPDEPPPSSGG